MTKYVNEFKNKFKTVMWGIKLAWEIDRNMLLIWTIISIGLSLLPAFILLLNRSIIAGISEFLNSGKGQFSDVVPTVIILGIILTISGLSVRLNDDLLYTIMFDSYYLGLEEKMMDAGQQIEISELLKKEVNDEYYAVISRCGSLTDLISSGCSLLSIIVSLCSLMMVALTVSPIIFFTSLFYIVGVIFLNITMSDKVRVVWSELREHLRRADYFVKVSQDGDMAKETRIYESYEKIKNHFLKAYEKAEFMDLRQSAAYARLNFITNAGFYIFMAIVIAFSVYRVASGLMGTDTLLMLFTMCTSMAANIASISGNYQRMDYGLYSLEKQRRFFDNTPQIRLLEETKKSHDITNEDLVFSAENLYFSYNNKQVLKNISFEIKKGETVALVGTNGSGKTTLVKLMLGLLKPASGNLKFMGRNVCDYPKGFLSKCIGSFFQEFYLFHFTLGENVGIGNIKNVDIEEEILFAMKKGGALKLVGNLPNGLHTLIGRQVYKEGVILSGGERQRIAVSRAHMSNKDVLVFDEPASMLDPIAEMEQFYNIKERLEGRTAILVSHRIGFARLADRILVLANGELIEDGTHNELIKKDGLYAKLFCEQAQWYDKERVGQKGDSIT